MRWTGNVWINESICAVCNQPGCPESVGGSRPAPGCSPSRLAPGEHEYRGYQEWAVHPDEASFLLHRGYAVVDGEPRRVVFIHNEAFVTQLRVIGTDPLYALEEKYWDPTVEEPTHAAV